MESPGDKRQSLDREYLPVRAKLLEVAAALDRLDRSSGTLDDDPRQEQLLAAIQVLVRNEPQRAEQLQLLFSRDYSPDWRDKFQL